MLCLLCLNTCMCMCPCQWSHARFCYAYSRHDCRWRSQAARKAELDAAARELEQERARVQALEEETQRLQVIVKEKSKKKCTIM